MIKAKYPSLNITGKDEAYVSALVDSLESQLGDTSIKDQIDLLTKTSRKQVNQNIVDSAKSREQYAQSLSSAWQVNPRTGK
jgi:Fic family protein